MSKSKETKSSGNRNPLRNILESLVVPVMEDEAAEPTEPSEGFEAVGILGSDDEDVWLHAILAHGVLVRVAPYPIDGERTLLRIGMLAGYAPQASGFVSAIIGAFLEATPFHVQADGQLLIRGRVSIGCDLVVRSDDEPLVRMRIGELLDLSRNLNWFFPLRIPASLSVLDTKEMEVDWDDLPHGSLDDFLRNAMEAPPAERVPRTLLQVARSLGEWKTVLRLLREHPEELPAQQFAPLKMLACRELGRWLQAIRAAEEGGIEDGRFPDVPWLSASYLHALVEVGEEIEALRLLGAPTDEEPSFHDWLRGLALHRSGDPKGARKAFNRYFDNNPGDLIGLDLIDSLSAD